MGNIAAVDRIIRIKKGAAWFVISLLFLSVCGLITPIQPTLFETAIGLVLLWIGISCGCFAMLQIAIAIDNRKERK